MPYASLPRRQPPKMPKSRFFGLYFPMIIAALLLGGITWYIFSRQDAGTPAGTESTEQQSTFDKSRFSIDDPASPWVIVNKQRQLNPADYAPSDLTTPEVPLKYDAGNDESKLRSEAAQALEEMFFSAKYEESIELIFVSGYRSYSYQNHLFNYYVGLQGEAVALAQSARPGHSEHQTGWAADVGALNRECEIETCFGGMPEGRWVAEHAHEFGFILRYPKGLTDTTGFDYEPWHLRYVGKTLAAELQHTRIQTLETFFGLPAAPEY